MSKQLIQGQWFPKGSAALKPAYLWVFNEAEYRLEIENMDAVQASPDSSESQTRADEAHSVSPPSNRQVHEEGLLSELHMSDRLGRIETRLTLQDGSVFTTDDHQAIDQLWRKTPSISHYIHSLESSLKWAFVAILVTTLTVYSFARWGVPWLSYEIAHALPESTNVLISEGTLELLDEHLFTKTQVSQAEQQRIREHFQNTLVPLEQAKSLPFKLHFRQWKMGKEEVANALALPSGDIILTDKFVELADTQAQMDAVLLHEMGHVVQRHGLEKIIQSTAISLSFVMIFGDSSGVVDIVVGTAGLLVSSAYSRNHELEADKYAFKKMLQARIDPKNFAIIMQRLSGEDAPKDHEKTANNIGQAESDEPYSDYFSTHPNSKQRIQLANQYSLCFQRGDFVCESVTE